MLLVKTPSWQMRGCSLQLGAAMIYCSPLFCSSYVYSTSVFSQHKSLTQVKSLVGRHDGRLSPLRTTSRHRAAQQHPKQATPTTRHGGRGCARPLVQHAVHVGQQLPIRNVTSVPVCMRCFCATQSPHPTHCSMAWINEKVAAPVCVPPDKALVSAATWWSDAADICTARPPAVPWWWHASR